MKNKLNQVGNGFYITDKKTFTPQYFSDEQLDITFEFAYGMTFGKEGEHRGYRSGGQYSRRNGELFANTFQGKLAEFAFFNLLNENNISTNEPDLDKWELGKWDESDFTIYDKKVSIKSAAHFSNLLLLETKDWKDDGTYLPNNSSYDYHVLIRISPDIKSILRQNKLFYSDIADKSILKKIVDENNFSYDIPGFISNEELIEIIKSKFILPQNGLLNGKVPMDAENYYCQSGDMQNIKSLIELFTNHGN
jgi:hypothetical protein